MIYEEKSHRLFLLPSFFRIYEDRVEAFFWPYKHAIPTSDIEEVKIVERIPWYVCWGLRINLFEKKLYFAVHHGKSVDIKRRSGYWREVVLSVKDPENFVSLLKR